MHPAFIRTPIHDRTREAGLQLEGFSREEPIDGVVAKLVAACEGRRRSATWRSRAAARCSSRSRATCPALVDRVVARTLAKRVAAGELDDARDRRRPARTARARRMSGDDSFFALVLLPIALAVIMGSLGLSLTIADFKRVVVYPKGVAIGLLNLLLISPLLAFGIAELYDLEPELAVGLVLMGAAPGGATANLMTHLAQGRHRAVGDDDRDQQPGGRRSRCRSTWACRSSTSTRASATTCRCPASSRACSSS